MMLRALAFVLTVALLGAASPTYYGNVYLHPSGVCKLSADFGAVGDDVTPDDVPMANAIAAYAVGSCNTILMDGGKEFLLNNAIAIPYIAGVWPAGPASKPLLMTCGGAAWDSELQAGVPVANNRSGALDLRYTGLDGLHPAKIDLRGAGTFELAGCTIEDKAADNFLFLQTTNTRIKIHDNRFIGNPAGGAFPHQDAIRLGARGFVATTLTTTNGSTSISTGVGDPTFVGTQFDYIYFGTTANRDAGTLQPANISSVTDAHHAVLTVPANQTIAGNGVAYFFATQSGPNDAFQGYPSVIQDNLYSHIRRAIIWGEYANGVYVRNEMIDVTNGCSNSDIPNCAPFYFEDAGAQRVGNILVDLVVETHDYPYCVSLQNQANSNVINSLACADAGGVATNFGGVWMGSASVTNNTTSVGNYTPSQSYAPSGAGGVNGTGETTVALAASAGTQTLTPASMAGITTSQRLLIDPDGSGVQEWATPSAVTGTTFTVPLANAHAAGFRVVQYSPIVSGAGRIAPNPVLANGTSTDSWTQPLKGEYGGKAPYITTQNFTGPIVLQGTGQFATGAFSPLSDGKTVSSTIGSQAYSSFGNLNTFPSTFLSCWGGSTAGGGPGLTCSNATGAGVSGTGVVSSAWGLTDYAGNGNILGVDTAGNMGIGGRLAIRGSSAPAYVPPVYTGASSGTAATTHMVLPGSCTMSAATTCAITTMTGTESPFASNTSFSCWASTTGSGAVTAVVSNQTTTSLTVTASASNSQTWIVGCLGT